MYSKSGLEDNLELVPGHQKLEGIWQDRIAQSFSCPTQPAAFNVALTLSVHVSQATAVGAISGAGAAAGAHADARTTHADSRLAVGPTLSAVASASSAVATAARRLLRRRHVLGLSSKPSRFTLLSIATGAFSLPCTKLKQYSRVPHFKVRPFTTHFFLKLRYPTHQPGNQAWRNDLILRYNKYPSRGFINLPIQMRCSSRDANIFLFF